MLESRLLLAVAGPVEPEMPISEPLGSPQLPGIAADADGHLLVA